MLQKPLVLAVIATSLAVGSVPNDASAGGDPLLGALVGAGVGAAIGHGVSGRDGAWVGGALGAITGASIAASSGGITTSYYGAPANSYPPRRPTTGRHPPITRPRRPIRTRANLLPYRS
jgi:hypothetical protein